MRTALTFVLVISLTSACLADVLVLKDGTRLEGEIKRAGSGWIVKTSDGKTIEVPSERVKSIEVGKGGSTTKSSADAAMSSLLSLRRSVEAVSDLHQIIDRFKRFIDQYKNSPAAEEAQKDLAIWEERLERGLVKLGTRWVTPQERTEAADKALVIADQARDLVAHGRLHDATPMLQQALDADPQCAPALFLRGVIQYQQNQIPPSRKSFEAVAALIDDHGPSLNNLAVILWRQNATMPALAKYEQAMVASPANKPVLDNVAEALAALPDNDRKNRVAQSAYRRFMEQDAQLQQIMAAQGLYRWGSSWVDRATMEEFRKVEKEVNEKIALAKTESDAAEKQVRTIDDQLQTIERAMRQIESDSVSRDAKGNLIRLPYPPAYYDLQNEESRLRSERKSQFTKYNAAQAQLKVLQGQLPKPKYTGLQQLIGAEGTPVMMMPGQAAPRMNARPNAPPPTEPTTFPTDPPPQSSPPTSQPASADPLIPAPAWPPASQPTSTDTDPQIPAPSWPPAPATQPTTVPSTSPTTQP